QAISGSRARQGYGDGRWEACAKTAWRRGLAVERSIRTAQANRLRRMVFAGDGKTLACGCTGPGAKHSTICRLHEAVGLGSVCTINVAGPSLTRCTCILAANCPVATGTPVRFTTPTKWLKSVS